MGKTYYKHKSLHKYTAVASSQIEVGVMSMIDLVLVKRDMLQYVQNDRKLREIGRSLSDHYVAFCKVRLVDIRIKRREEVNGTKRVRNEKMREHQHGKGYDVLKVSE